MVFCYILFIFPLFPDAGFRANLYLIVNIRFNYFDFQFCPHNLFDDVSGTKFFLIMEERFPHKEGDRLSVNK